jgi:hypothetical protein
LASSIVSPCEIAAVDGEDFARALALGDAEDGGVAKIHRPIGNGMPHRLDIDFANGAASDFLLPIL